MTSDIIRVPVRSRNIASVGYDAESRRLHVEFREGGVWEYSGVEPERHAALLKAESVGGHFAAHVRGKLAAKRVG